MREPQNMQRRSFLGTGLLGTAAAGAATAWLANSPKTAHSAPLQPLPKSDRLPREVWIATIGLGGIRAKDPAEMTQTVLGLMQEIVPFQPDVICLPETFLVGNLSSRSPALQDIAEEPIGEFCRPFADFAARHGCYVVCPIHTRHGDKLYNSAVFIDRTGGLLGEYHKAHPTTGEIADGVTAGPLEAPVFEADFGKIGAQICFDIEWTDSWQSLHKAGAEIIFWPSAFAGGAMVSAKAWQHQCGLVSSTLKDTSKICDVTGEEVAKTSRWHQWVCAPLNLEKAFLHTWPYVARFPEIEAQYGRKIRIRTFAEEEWSILESRSPEVKIADVLQEFQLKTLAEHLQTADAAQCLCRPAPS